MRTLENVVHEHDIRRSPITLALTYPCHAVNANNRTHNSIHRPLIHPHTFNAVPNPSVLKSESCTASSVYHISRSATCN